MMAKGDEARLALYRNLHELFTSYHVLTGQIREAALAAEAEQLLELIGLRQEMLSRIEHVQAAAPAAFGVPFEHEADPAVLSLRRAIRQLISDCQAKEEGLTERFERLNEQMRAEARQANLSQRRVNSYTRQLTTPSRYIEERK